MSKQFTTLDVEHRGDKKVESIKSLRKQSYIPGVVCGENEESQSIKIKEKNWKTLLDSKELIFSIQNGDNKELVSLASVERGAFGSPLHLSLARVKRNVLTEVMIPIKLIGERKASDKATIQQHMFELKMEAIPTDIPQSIDIDIEALNEGDSIKVSDLKLPKGVKTMESDAQDLVVECNYAQTEEVVELEAVEAPIADEASVKKPE